MKTHKWSVAAGMLFVLLGIAVLTMKNSAESSSCCPGESSAEAKLETHDTHDHCAVDDVSALDRSLDDLWTATCEHDVLHYTCDECRYELGIVKVSDRIISKDGRPGIVSITRPVERPMGRPLSLTGEVVTNDLASYHAAGVAPGIIRRIMTDIGGRVSKGDVLAEIDSLEAAEARGDYLKKSAAYSLATKTAEREASLFAKKVTAEAEVMEARNRQIEAGIELAGARTRLERMGLTGNEIESLGSASPGSITGILPIRACIDGMVLERFVRPGDMVDAGQEIMLLSDISEVWINADIRESDWPLLSNHHTGIPCEVRTPGTESITLPGTLTAVSGKMNESTRTIPARVTVKNPDGRLRPGMFVNVNVMIPGKDRVLAVPDNAVLSDGGRHFVFVHKDGDYWVRRPVETGLCQSGFTEITKGLTKDQLVTAGGSFLLKSDVLREKMGAGCAD